MPCIGATAACPHKAVRMNWCKQYNHFIHSHRMTEIPIDRTGQSEVIAARDGRLTVTVPIRIKRRGLRKVVTLPDGGHMQPRPWEDTPTPLQLALARGHRWLAMLESGEAKSMKEIARREGVDDSYVSRMVNLITLAPDIVAAILEETLPPEVTLFELEAGMPLLWEEQRGRAEDGSMTRFERPEPSMAVVHYFMATMSSEWASASITETPNPKQGNRSNILVNSRSGSPVK
jgi:hypothetical protein